MKQIATISALFTSWILASFEMIEGYLEMGVLLLTFVIGILNAFKLVVEQVKKLTIYLQENDETGT